MTKFLPHYLSRILIGTRMIIKGKERYRGYKGQHTPIPHAL